MEGKEKVGFMLNQFEFVTELQYLEMKELIVFNFLSVDKKTGLQKLNGLFQVSQLVRSRTRTRA